MKQFFLNNRALVLSATTLTTGLLAGIFFTWTNAVTPVTVPLLEIPNGRGYLSFFSYPLLYLLAAVNVLSVYLYWRLKVVRQ